MNVEILGVPIAVTSVEDSIGLVQGWAEKRLSKTVNFCNVHSVISALDSEDFMHVLKRGDLNLPDGGPIATQVAKKSSTNQKRISGPDFMRQYLSSSQNRVEKIYLYGGTEDILAKIVRKLQEDYPWVEVVGMHSPVFMDTAILESEEQIARINASGANTLWVSLGCPKQEAWMDLHKNKINAVMLAVGAAFPFISGDVKRAPQWMRNHSLEWLYRFYCEPRRLFWRYFYTNTRYIFTIIKNEIILSK